MEIRWLRLAAVLMAMTALTLPAMSSVAGAAKPPKPTVVGLTVSAPDQVVMSSSPLVFYNGGGNVGLSAQVTNAVSCDFTSSPHLKPLPQEVGCSSGPVTIGLFIPPNTGKKAVKYTFKLRVVGRGSARAMPLTVTVSTATAPPLPPDLQPGAFWTLSIPATDYCELQEIGPDNTFTAASVVNDGAEYSGTFSFDDPVLSEVYTDPASVVGTTFQGTWVAADQTFEGSLNADTSGAGETATLTPSESCSTCPVLRCLAVAGGLGTQPRPLSSREPDQSP